MSFSFTEYFEDNEVTDGFKKEFISLWTSWLGKENYHKMDDVFENDWKKFNHLIIDIFQHYEMLIADFDKGELIKIDNVEKTFSTYEESMDKSSSKFSYYVIPQLNCVLEEHWDYTYILWYKNNYSVEELGWLIEKSGLFHFPNE